MIQLKKLFESIKLGNVELKNRVVMLAMGTSLATGERFNEQVGRFYIERAKGGAGLLIFPALPVYEGGYLLPALYDDEFIPDIRNFVKQIHALDTKIFVQLLGRWEFALERGGVVEAMAPSPIATRPNVPLPRVLTVAEIQQLVEAFASAARRAREAGFDGVEFQGGIGYLINRFISSCTNQRTDQYGGSLEKRMRFLLDIIERTGRLAGEDYPIICRISVDEFMKGGHSLEDSRQVARILEKAGVAALDTQAGWHECPVPLNQMSVPRGAFVYLAHEMKKVVNIPVIAANRINDPILAEEILAQGKADLIGMARALLADPEFPRKAREGKFDDIVPCIACTRCLLETWLDKTGVQCSVNPRAGREEIVPLPVEKPRNIMIVGGGPAGMQAAIVAARRGHRVKLYEKNDKLGGQLIYAAIPPFKDEIKNLTRYLVTQLNKSHVEINLSTEVNAQFVKKQKPDVVVIATGAVPAIPGIPGAAGNNVVDPLRVLDGCPCGERVVVIGGGKIGCEMAEFLACQGKKVVITSRQPKIGMDIARNNRWVIMQRLRKSGIEMYPDSQPLEITANGVKLSINGAFSFFEADTVVLAGGMKADNRLAKELEGKVSLLHIIGDCAEPSDIMEAIRDGFLLACKI